jgi:oxygen-independent coproporphyrinogen-3 oxidase
MAGIYFHIPFCRQKCNYCDFYSKRDSTGVKDLVESEIEELVLRKDYIKGEKVNTIYFGGGTPSLLSIDYLKALLGGVKESFDVSQDCEITLEANPDDLTVAYLTSLFKSGINRLSVGIQSYNNDILKFLGRRHDRNKLTEIIHSAQRAGFGNISVDLIFAIPGMDFEVYIDSLDQVIQLGIQHVSAYSLTIEKGTYFYKLLQNNKIGEIGEEEMLRQYNATIDMLSQNGFDQYEISNYAKQGFKSRHNSSYWNDEMYLGIGPSDHSYNRVSRQWNVSDTKKYITNISLSAPFWEIEYLTKNDKFNEYLITGLRTTQGISIDYVNHNFDGKIIRHFNHEVDKLLNSNMICYNKDRIVLTRKGMLISDFILRQLYFL